MKITKYFLVLALLSTAACSGASPDDTSSRGSAVDDKPEGDKPTEAEPSKDSVPPSKDEPSKDPGKDSEPPSKDPGAPSTDGCRDVLASLDALIQQAAIAGDVILVQQLKEKYAVTQASCNPPAQADGCRDVLASLDALIQKAAASGDTGLVQILKDKYGATVASCSAPTAPVGTKDAPPIDKK